MNKMNITSAQYVTSRITNENGSITAVIDGVELSVPLSLDNRHYAEIMRQVKAGDLTIEDAD
jgi:hypothetical protein